MNRARLGLMAVVASGLAAAGCASGSGGGGGGGGFEMEGYAPSDNTHTRTAQFALLQAGEAGDGGEARFREALAAALTSIAQEPTNPRGYMLAGQAQIGLADYVAADSLFDKALELYPAYAEDVRFERENGWITLFNAALEPIDAGDHEEGVRMLEAAEALYTRQRPEALMNLGLAYTNTGRLADAIDAYGAALDIIRSPSAEGVDSAMVAGWAGHEESVSFNRAQLLSQAERYDEAIEEYEAYLANHPGDVRAVASMASVLAMSGMPDSAQAVYDGLMASADQLGMRELMNVGVGLYRAEAYETAANAFRRVARVAPDSRDAVSNLAQSLSDSEAWEELLEVGARLVELDGFNSYSYRLYAQALVNSGDEQTAVEILEQGEALEFEFNAENTLLQPRSSGGATLAVELVNKSLEPGTTVEVRVHFLGDDGAEIGAVDVRAIAPDAGAATVFQADLTSEEAVLGYYLEVLSH